MNRKGFNKEIWELLSYIVIPYDKKNSSWQYSYMRIHN